MGTSRLPVFQERFKLLRGKMTQGEFAEKLGISRPTVGLYESGARIPDAEVLLEIAKKCDVSADWLLGITNVKHVNEDIRMICEATGLSAGAICTLQSVVSAPSGRTCLQVPDIIDHLLCDPAFFDEFMGAIQDAFQCMRPCKESTEAKEALRVAGENGYFLMMPFEAKEFFVDQAVGSFKAMLNEMIDHFMEAENGEHQED